MALAEALKVNTTVTAIRLNCALCAECCWARAAVGARHPFVTLTGRRLDNSIGDAGAAALAEALKVNTTVTTIDLAGALCAECCWAHRGVGQRAVCRYSMPFVLTFRCGMLQASMA